MRKMFFNAPLLLMLASGFSAGQTQAQTNPSAPAGSQAVQQPSRPVPDSAFLHRLAADPEFRRMATDPNLQELSRQGVKIVDGKQVRTPEVTRLFLEADYRKQVYSTPHTLEAANALWQQGKYLLAMYIYGFVYEQQPEAVVAQLKATGVRPALLQSGAINSFLTYGIFDPEMVSFTTSGRMQVDRPELIEVAVARCKKLGDALFPPPLRAVRQR